MKIHEVKSWPEFFRPIADGSKPFDVRKDDRGYKVGDVLYIREFDDRKGTYTGHSLRKLITFVHRGVPGGVPPLAGLSRDYVVLGFRDEVPA